jgi:hypothetical protein
LNSSSSVHVHRPLGAGTGGVAPAQMAVDPDGAAALDGVVLVVLVGGRVVVETLGGGAPVDPSPPLTGLRLVAVQKCRSCSKRLQPEVNVGAVAFVPALPRHAPNSCPRNPSAPQMGAGVAAVRSRLATWAEIAGPWGVRPDGSPTTTKVRVRTRRRPPIGAATSLQELPRRACLGAFVRGHTDSRFGSATVVLPPTGRRRTRPGGAGNRKRVRSLLKSVDRGELAGGPPPSLALSAAAALFRVLPRRQNQAAERKAERVSRLARPRTACDGRPTQPYCQTRAQSRTVVARAGVPAPGLLLPRPSAAVKFKKNGWLKGSGAVSGLVTYGAYVSVTQATPS